MHHMRMLDIYICDRCGEQAQSDNVDPLKGWLVATVALIEAQTATTTHHLCPECRQAVGSFLEGHFVPPIDDMIEDPYESLVWGDFVPSENGQDWQRAPWECHLDHDGHVYGWVATAEGLTRYCRMCGLKWASVRRIEGAA